MKKVTILPILIFSLLMSLPICSTLLFIWELRKIVHNIFLGDFILCLCSTLFFLAGVTSIYRFFLKKWPFSEGELPSDHPHELRYLVYLIFWLLIFNPLLRISIIPAPLSRLVLLALGSKVGKSSYSSGLVLDPHLVTIGHNTQLGLDCLIVPHNQTNDKLAHYPIKIGNNVTIGGRAVVMAGCTIDDGAVVGFCSF